MSKAKIINILFSGIGGQGVLKAAEISAWAAILEGYHVKKSEVHGMAQRGGSVESHLRFAKEVFSPLVPAGEVDYLVPFHIDEGLRQEHLLRKEGINLDKYLKNAHAYLPDARYLNIFLLGVLSQFLPIKKANWQKAIEKELFSRNLVENKAIFLKGGEVKL
jgi:indolepyruvate ferredoxin oxidoreductase, beta subunit